ncbi:Helicase C-terminal, partial [Penicillium antarcticum]|uniref:Helicase C-terminal n=1 Tax=Penicillium antarcticum TaxID=416450 RepID=UPI002395E5A7
HHIRNRSSKTFEAVCGVRANYRWCLTGTPIHNRLDDYGALLSFIRVDPFTGSSGKTVFSHWVSSSVWTETNNTERLDRLKKLVAATCLRRTKQNVRNQLSLPRRTDKEHLVELHSSERLLYDFFKTRASSIVARSTVHHAALERRGWGNILTIINSLRLICNHGEELLSSSSLELWKRRDTFTDDLNWHENTSQLSTGASRSHDPHDLPLPVTNSGQVSSKCCAPSSKVKALINNLRAEQNELTPNDSETPIKSVIFSYWTSMLDLIAVALRENGFEFERIDGQTPLERRLLALKTLHDDPKCTVMLASIGSIAEGVDLTAASRVHIIEPQWNPMVEAQALDRVHRMGQTRDVVTTRYIVKDSIETVS